jgi:hypothetical protein
MSGAIPTLHQYAFMAWCSVKVQGQLYLLPLPRERWIGEVGTGNTGYSTKSRRREKKRLSTSGSRHYAASLELACLADIFCPLE